jgi:hypothetical protein
LAHLPGIFDGKAPTHLACCRHHRVSAEQTPGKTSMQTAIAALAKVDNVEAPMLARLKN